MTLISVYMDLFIQEKSEGGNVRGENVRIPLYTCMSLLVNVLPLGKFLASMFSILYCFPPFSLIPHTAILSETNLAYRLVFFSWYFSYHPTLYPLSLQAFISEYMTDPVFFLLQIKFIRLLFLYQF